MSQYKSRVWSIEPPKPIAWLSMYSSCTTASPAYAKKRYSCYDRYYIDTEAFVYVEAAVEVAAVGVIVIICISCVHLRIWIIIYTHFLSHPLQSPIS